MEVNKIKQFIYNTLSVDSQIISMVAARIFDAYVPESVTTTQFPAVLYTMYAPRSDLDNVGGYRVWANIDYIIKVIDKSSNFGNAGLIMDRVDTLLNRKSSGTYSIESCLRVNPIEYREKLPQVEYVHIGGIYNFKVSSI